jgi:hypothetical protein
MGGGQPNNPRPCNNDVTAHSPMSTSAWSNAVDSRSAVAKDSPLESDVPSEQSAPYSGESNWCGGCREQFR